MSAVDPPDAPADGKQLTADQCVNWRSTVYQLDQSQAAKLGFSVGSVGLSRSAKLIVVDVARTTVISEADRHQTWGFGYRLVIEVAEYDSAAALTLPMLAATVQAKAIKSTVTLEVKGYKGDELWTALPVPRPLDVDSYRDYMDAANKVQSAFAQNRASAVPVLLAEEPQRPADGGFTDLELEDGALAASLLRRVARGDSLDEAMADLAESSPDQTADIELIGQALLGWLGVGDDGELPPDNLAKVKRIVSLAAR